MTPAARVAVAVLVLALAGIIALLPRNTDQPTDTAPPNTVPSVADDDAELAPRG